EWRFRTSDPKRDAIIAFGHLQYERDKQNHQGRAYAFLGFDEATHFTESQFLYLLSR
ncbi:MAG: Terminase-like family protein, partial [Desulfuromonadales bacterium]|nr:Terminase-like family protein [Desulfuromonadales bacterium]